jgi:hypothetical protein
MFNILEGLAKAAVGVVSLPVTAVYDLVDNVVDDSYNKPTLTGQTFDSIGENLRKAFKSD